MQVNTIIYDIETARSADQCRFCGALEADHAPPWHHCRTLGGQWEHNQPLTFARIGWENKPALGLSIGCYYDGQDGHYTFFDVHTLEATMRSWVERQALMVSFNGLTFDGPLLRGLLRREAEALVQGDLTDEATLDRAQGLVTLCDAFKVLCSSGYDILDQIWRVKPEDKFKKGLNSLGAISVANGYGRKDLDGALAPTLWQQGQIARVLNYCRADVTKTKLLFEQIIATGGLLRGDGWWVALPQPVMP
jgi:hypothetical protein